MLTCHTLYTSDTNYTILLFRPQEPHLRFMLLFLKHHNSDLSEVTVDAQRVLKVARRYVYNLTLLHVDMYLYCLSVGA